MLSRRVVILSLIALALAFGCRRKPATPPDVVVRIGDRMLTLGDFKRYLERNTGTDLAQMGPEVASAVLDQYVEEIILSEYAATHGIEVPAEKIAAAVRTEAGSTVIEKRDEMRREKLIAKLATEVAEPTAEEIRDYYQKHLDDFQSGEQVRVRQILVREEKTANEIAAKLARGGSFEELSNQHSLAPNAKRGGEIGFVSRGELPKMFEDEIFALQPGKVSPVIRTDTTYHLFKVEDRRTAGTMSVETAAPLIIARIKEDAIRQEMAQLVSRSRREMNVAVLTRRLPFRYSGTLRKAENE